MYSFFPMMPNCNVPHNNGAPFDFDAYRRFQEFIESEKRKDEEKNKKKDDKKPPGKWKPTTVEATMIMLLLSPITGPTMLAIWKMAYEMTKASLN